MSIEEHRVERQQEKAQAVVAIEQALSAVEAECREPDQWERTLFIRAINCLFRGAYRLATIDAQFVLRRPQSRASRLQADRSLDRFNVSILRAGFQEAVAEPVSDYPVFNPVVFSR